MPIGVRGNWPRRALDNPLALRRASSGESQPWVSRKISILAFSRVFHGDITLERSHFRQIPTNVLTFIYHQVCMFVYSSIAHS